MSTKQCTLCNQACNSTGEFISHRKLCIKSHDTELVTCVLAAYNSNMPLSAIKKQYNVSQRVLNYILTDNNVARRPSIKIGYKTPQSVKDKISDARIKWLRNNPDKHVWRTDSRYISNPCEIVKRKLRDAGISFVEEYMPLSNRAFSIDIAFPSHNIGIEINGNQHYRRSGELTEYYQSRHDLIESSGWTLYEYHYSIAYDNNLIDAVIGKLKTTYTLGELDYSFYIKHKEPKPITRCSDCGVLIHYTSTRCVKCNNLIKNVAGRKVKIRPSYEQLIADVSNMSMVCVGKKYNVSDNAIRKWIRSYEVK